MPIAVAIPGVVPSPRVIEFVVDTGAMQTCIHVVDAVRALRIDPGDLIRPPQTWTVAGEASGVGGKATYYTHGCSYGFLSLPGGQLRTIAGQVYLARLSEGTVDLPSILGWDMLQHFRVDIDYAAGRVRLMEPGEA